MRPDLFPAEARPDPNGAGLTHTHHKENDMDHTPTTEDVRFAVAGLQMPSGRFITLVSFERWLQSVKAAAWEEGALWAAVEITGDDRYEKGAAFLAPGENPYEPTGKP